MVLLFCHAEAAHPQDFKLIQLPEPRDKGGKPLMQALKERKSQREFSSKELPPEVLSDLLWAAAGVNRPETDGHTNPTAKNMREIDIYAAKKEGLYLYDARSHALVPLLDSDIRHFTGTQSFVKDAPVNLIYVTDHAKMSGLTGEQKDFYSATDTGFISQNVYLFCASEGLATVVRGWFNKLELTKAMRLRPSQSIVLTQTVGYPKD